MDLDKLKSKLAADLNAAQSQGETNAKQAPGDTRKSSDPVQKQAPADSSGYVPQQAEQKEDPTSFADNSVNRFLHPARIWPD